MPDPQTPKLYGSIAELRAANKAAGQHWCDEDALRFFDGIVPEDQPIIHGRFFVSSEQFDRSSPRLHTLRYANAEAHIKTVGAFQQFESFDDARNALNEGIAQGVTVRQVSGPPDADPANYHWQVYLGDLPIDCSHNKTEVAMAAEEMTVVLGSKTPPSTAGDYEPEPKRWECERNVLGEILRFEWAGGIYIEVSCPPGDPQEVINITDDTTGCPRIERTQEAFEQEVDRWIKSYGPKDLRHDVVENWTPRPR
jgi:hypothetical protein